MPGCRATRLPLGDALRAFVHAEEVADAVAGAMVVVVTGLPQGHAGQHVELDAGSANGSGPDPGNMTLQYPGKHGLCSSVTPPTLTVCGMSVVPSRYWAPESTR